MCRYAIPYKEHYACFECRKSFKKPNYFDLPKQLRPESREELKYFCPQCRNEMYDMGMDFKAPKQSDIKQWKKVEILFQNGFTYHSCGCCGPGLRPAQLNQVEEFLAGNLEKSEGEKLLVLIAEKTRNKRVNI